MSTDRRALLAGLSGLSTALALAGCRRDADTTAGNPLDNQDVQNAMSALIESVDTLKKAVGAFGAANCKDVAVQVRAATAEVSTNLNGLREALGFPDSN
jgi:hypothetical protein